MRYLSWLWRIPLVLLVLVELASFFNLIHAQPYYTALGLLLQAVTAFVCFEILYKQLLVRRLRMPWWFVLGAISILVLDALGDYFYWYQTITYYDSVLHFLSPAVVVSGLWSILHQAKPKAYKLWLTCIVTGTIALGALYEVEEYLEDILTKSNRLGDGPDTGNDLLMDVLGAVTPIVLGYYSIVKRKLKF